MNPKIRFSASALAVIIAALGVLAALAPPMHAKPAAPRAKTWIRTGRRYALSALEGKWARPLPGRFSAICSAQQVRALAFRSDTLWIGTEGGLFAYSVSDDAVSAVAGPASLSVRSIAFDQGGALWVGSDYGISVRSRGSWKSCTKESLPFFGRIRCMVEGESRLWIGTYGNGCGYVINDNLTVFGKQDSLLDERVLAIMEESPTTVYFGTASGLIEADSLGWKSLRYGSRLPIGPVNALALDEDENLYLAVDGQGMAVLSFGRVRTFGTAQDLPGADVRAFSLDPAGRVWAGGGSGVSIFNGSEWAPCTAAGMAAKRYRVLSMRHDDEGTCYLGTDDGKVVVVSRETSKEISVPQAFTEARVPRIRPGNGAVWLIGGRSIYSWKGSFSKAAAPPDLYADEMTDLVSTETGEIWATTRFGILHYTTRGWEVFDRKNGLPTEYFTRVARDPAGTLWFAPFDGGIVTYAAGAWTTLGRESGLPADAVEDLTLDTAGNPWIVTRRGEIAHFIQGTWAKLRLPLREQKGPDTTRTADSLSQFDPAIRFLADAAGEADGTGGAIAYCLGFDKGGACLVGAPTGVYRLATTGWQTLDLPRSMAGSRPTAVLCTAKGDIWLGTAGKGVFVYRNGEWIRLGASAGLSDDYIRSLCEDQKGVVWIGTQFGGITRYAPPNGS